PDRNQHGIAKLWLRRLGHGFYSRRPLRCAFLPAGFHFHPAQVKVSAMSWFTHATTWTAIFAGFACAASVYLLLRSLSPAALPGCGDRGGCDAVLSSRWAKIGPVPVAGPGAALYLLL